MRKFIITIGIVVLILGAIYFLPGRSPAVTDFRTCIAAGYPTMESYPRQCQTPDGRIFTEELTEDAEVIIDAPAWGAVVSSPLRVSGQARGNWFFEANLPVRLEDQNGNLLAQKGFQAHGDWMTEDYVHFEDELVFSQPQTEFGRLVIEKDNASGLPEHDASFAVPVRFSSN